MAKAEPIYGTLPSNWKMATIKALIEEEKANLQTGPFGTMLHASAYRQAGIPVVAVQHIGNNRLIHTDMPRVDDQTYQRLIRYRLQSGDIIFGRKGSVERRALIRVDEEGWLQGSDCIRLRLNPSEIDPGFISYVLGTRAFQNWILQHAHGATMPSLNQEILGRVPLPIPPLREQCAITEILGALDDKIELNRHMNRTLESMARAVCRQWFVENEEFENWEVQALEQYIQAEKGLSYKGEGLSKGTGMPMHNLNSVYEGGGYKYEGIKYYTGEYRERHIIRAGDIIVANTEQGFEYLLIGFPAIVPKHFGETGIFSHHIFRVSILPNSPVKTHYLYFLLMSTDVREQIIGCTNGTTVNMLSADGLRMPRFRLPPKELIDRFEQFASPIFDKMEILYEESRTLASLRDTLLPKLMRGEVRVKGL